MTTELVAVDDFAGTGWGVACHWLGIREYGVELMPEAVATRATVGFETIYNDVWDGIFSLEKEPAHNLRISSPPCQTFSVAGRGDGRRALDQVLEIARSGEWKHPELLRQHAVSLGDERTALVLTPLTRVYQHDPDYVVLEQVPTVLPVWQAIGRELATMGYSVWVGKLNAEQYGVPQTRTRAILIARKDGKVAAPPAPTHSRFYPRDPKRLDPGVKKWVSMAEALGWGMTARPYPTVATGAATAGGGTDPAALGGSGARRNVYEERAAGRWEPSGDVDNDTDGHTLRLQAPDAAALQSYPDWVFERPSTTVAGDPRIAGPGRSEFVKGGVSRQDRPGSFKVTADQLASIQSYPAPFPFQGSRTKQFLQIGNAVPPLLAEAILKEFT